MMLYHGSFCEVLTPDLSRSRLNLDFGKGFYLTDLQTQAEKWALRKRREFGSAVVSVFEFKQEDLMVFRFNGYSVEWLDYIVSNRGYGIDTLNVDVIIGNVANDEVVVSINNYIRLLEMDRSTHIQKLATLEQLTYSKPSSQVCFKTVRSLKHLKFLESYALGD